MNKYIDHTLLKADSTYDDIKNLCNEAVKYNFASVCVNGYWVEECYKLLRYTDIKVCTVIGFPLGATTSKTKVFETIEAINNGAQEIDMVMNIGEFKNKNYAKVRNDIEEVVNIANGLCVKVIIETCLLTRDEIVKACKICVEAKATFVKTSTGFSKSGAIIEDVKLMNDVLKGKCKIKASGGIKTYKDIELMIKSGAQRIGTSSGVQIIKTMS